MTGKTVERNTDIFFPASILIDVIHVCTSMKKKITEIKEREREKKKAKNLSRSRNTVPLIYNPIIKVMEIVKCYIIRLSVQFFNTHGQTFKMVIK